MDANMSRQVEMKLQNEDMSRYETRNSRQNWSNKLEFIVSSISYNVGFGNLWRFPYICYKNGGGVFLIPYILSIIFAGIPMFFLEVSLGQYLSEGAISVWRITPAFKGVGYATIAINAWLNSYYIIIIAWMFFYFYHSFSTTLPWSTCDNPWNTQYCMSSYINKTNSSFCSDKQWTSNGSSISFIKNISYNFLTDCLNISKRTTPTQEFWKLKVLKMSEGLDEPGDMNWQLVGWLLLAWAICFLCIRKGVKWIGKVSWVTSIAPYILLISLLIRGITLPGSLNGIIYYLKPDFSKLLETEVWNDALTQIFFSYSLVLGSQIALGSYNKYHTNVMKEVIIVSVVNSGTSIFVGFVIFSVLGFMAHEQGKMLEDVVDSGPGLVFLAYPSAITQMPLSPLWSVLFFFTVLLVGISGQFCGVEGFVTAIVDLWPHKLKARKELVALCTCLTLFIVGLSMVTQGGIYVFELLNHFSASGILLTIIIFFECIAISYGYGVNRYMKALEHMLGFNPGRFWKLCWLVMIPLACLINIILTMVTYETLSYNDYEYPLWSIVLGWFITFSTVSFIPAFALFTWIKTSGSFRERLKQAFRPYVEDEPVHRDIISHL